MLQFFSIAVLALVGFSPLATAAPAAPVTAASNQQVAALSDIPAAAAFPANWNPNTASTPFGNYIDTQIAQSMAEHKANIMVKRDDDDDDEFSFEDMFRDIFDKIIDHVIEITPLNDIVHGNYDILWDLFTAKVEEAISNIGKDAEGVATAEDVEAEDDEYVEAEDDEDVEAEDDEDEDDEDEDEDEDDHHHWNKDWE